MRILLPLFVVSATGCDAIFDLEPIGPPPDAPACSPIGHDEDGDTLDDACDPCPFAVDNAGDDDGDGIALACDPDLVNANEVLVFSGFDAMTRSQFTATDGAFEADAFRVSGSGALVWNGDVNRVWVIAGFDVHELEDEAYREVGVTFDATPTNTNEVNGTYCVLGRSGEDYVEMYSRRRPDSDMVIDHSDSPLLALPDFHGTLRGSYDRARVPAAMCTFIGPTVQATVSGTEDPPPVPGHVALISENVDVSFRFVFIVR